MGTNNIFKEDYPLELPKVAVTMEIISAVIKALTALQRDIGSTGELHVQTIIGSLIGTDIRDNRYGLTIPDIFLRRFEGPAMPSKYGTDNESRAYRGFYDLLLGKGTTLVVGDEEYKVITEPSASVESAVARAYRKFRKIPPAATPT